ncbi:hypothetical protein GCM10009715_42020 [Paeniglutamicibacter psychrophenolicus]|uniref:Uncharacterized protein n=1 Tax=Paeniglutamicibacter psychrophenolicus TaxID=257454 RepID=A0ABS4WJT3_9MICC|nr:DUF6573 family protein [Paeniglutamicibacter psychrophenolicus]MBP2376460.1 hypothetical protein [Paeniglutamicibacter psychrophenolicus]
MPDSAIHAYTRAEALEDGLLIDVTETARGARLPVSVALTRSAWAYAVAWNDANPELQDEAGRLWDVLYLAGVAAGRAGVFRRVPFDIYRIPNTECPSAWCDDELFTLHLVIGRGDQAEPVITIMCTDED